MTLLADVCDQAELTAAVENGHVRLQRHPTKPLVIYNYTEACQYAGAWTPVTLACRGLIVGADGRVVAGPAVATRGSFTSDQARHATELLRTKYAGFVPPAGRTVLVEIIYPANRIVLDYAGMDDLVLLGAVDIATGRTFGPDAVPEWRDPVVEPAGWGRKEFAAVAVRSEHRSALFLRLDSKDYRPALWQQARPDGDRTMHGTKVTEE